MCVCVCVCVCERERERTSIFAGSLSRTYLFSVGRSGDVRVVPSSCEMFAKFLSDY